MVTTFPHIKHPQTFADITLDTGDVFLRRRFDLYDSSLAFSEHTKNGNFSHIEVVPLSRVHHMSVYPVDYKE